MERFKFDIVDEEHSFGDAEPCAVVDPDGEWVRWTDANERIATLEAQCSALKRYVDHVRGCDYLTGKPSCTCGLHAAIGKNKDLNQI